MAVEPLETRNLPSLASPTAFAIVPGPNGAVAAPAVATDRAGDIYVAGSFSGTVDFGAGPGATVLSIPALTSYPFIAKYTPTGRLIWVRAMVGSGGGGVLGLAVDRFGDVVATGQFTGTLDFDPGPSS
jgi:hypothetical protein